MPRSAPTAVLVQSIKSKGEINIDDDTMMAISDYIKKNEVDADKLDNVSMWVKDVIIKARDGSF